MLSIRVQTSRNRDTKRIRDLLRQYGNTFAASEPFKRVLDEWSLLDLDPALQENLSDKSGKFLRRRTGNLAARTKVIRPKVQKSAITVYVEVHGAPYARVHEYGNPKQVPTRSKYLTIPFKAALTPAGVLKANAREWPNTFFYENKSKQLMILQRGKPAGKGPRGGQLYGPPIALFLLKKSVNIPARKWISSAVNKAMPKLRERIDAEIDELIAGAGS